MGCVLGCVPFPMGGKKKKEKQVKHELEKHEL